MTAAQWFSLAFICWLGAATPGPSLLVMLRLSLSQGLKAGLLGAWSHALAIGFYAVLSLLFYSAVQATGSFWFYALVVLGQLWLLWLGASLLWQHWYPVPLRAKTSVSRFPEHWSQGFVIGIVNPKIWLFFIAVFSPFVNNFEASIGALAVLPWAIDGVWYSFIVMAANHPRIATVLNRSERVRDGLLGILLVLFALLALFGSVPQTGLLLGSI